MTTTRQQIVEMLRQYRQSQGLSQNDADRLLGGAEGLVSKWECGTRRPSLSSLTAWAQSMDCRITLEYAHTSPSEFFNEDAALAALESRGIRFQVTKNSPQAAETPVLPFHRTGISAPYSPNDIQPLHKVISHYIGAALAANGGNLRDTARKLRISYASIRRRAMCSK